MSTTYTHIILYTEKFFTGEQSATIYEFDTNKDDSKKILTSSAYNQKYILGNQNDKYMEFYIASRMDEIKSYFNKILFNRLQPKFSKFGRIDMISIPLFIAKNIFSDAERIRTRKIKNKRDYVKNS